MKRYQAQFLLNIGLICVAALAACTVTQRTVAHKYAYYFCKVRDSDPIVHQTVDSMLPVAGAMIGAGVSTACVLIETTTPTAPTVTAVDTPAK